jgi:multiple sugar transport system ATP-binding protein
MGRAIVRNPQVFCMDEPLSNLDAKLRVATRTQIASLQRRLGVTTVYVTHDQVEAMTMGDRVAVLKDGILQQCDRPRHMYDRPANMFVAGFIGSPAMNLFQLPVGSGGAPRLGGHDVRVERDVLQGLSSGTVALGVRPEDLHVVGTGEGIAATVEHDEVVLVARVNPKTPPMKGDKIWLAPQDSHHMHVFDPVDGRRLSA